MCKNWLFQDLLIIKSNNSQIKVRDVKICIQAIWAANITISLSNLRVYIEKIKVKKSPLPSRRISKKNFKASY